MDRQIICVGIPSVEVAVARLHDPTLSARPLAIAALNTPRALLREVSHEAEQEGLAVGMSVDHARRLCPTLHVPIQPRLEETALIEPDEVDDSALWGRLLDVLQRLCRLLRSQRRVCGRLSLTIRYSDQIKVMRRERVTPETCWEGRFASGR